MGGTARGTRAVELSIHPLVGLLERENLGEPHPVLAGGERYVSHRFADAAERVLRDQLAAAGLGHRDALLEFLDTLTVVQRASAEFYGWVAHGQRRYSVLAAALGRRAVVVVRDGERVRVEGTDPDRLAGALVRRLPDVPAGVGEPVSVLAADLGRRGQREAGAVLRRSAPARVDGARRLAVLAREPRYGGAKLYAAARGRGGVRRRSAGWVTLVDLHRGRWVVVAGPGERVVDAAPGTGEVVERRLGELRRSLPV